MIKLTLTLVCLFTSLAFSFAQGTPIEVPGSYSASIRHCTEFDGKLFFGAGNQLWRTDGTPQGTEQVKAFIGGPYGFTILNNHLYFIAKDATYGTELWVSDGTTAGTSIVKDINPNGSDSAFIASTGSLTPNLLHILNGKLYFVANDGVHGRELWESDGTAAGTVMVKDIFPVADSSSIPATTNINEKFLLAGNRIYFAANDGSGTGIELWSTDGTAVGTHLVKDIVPGAATSNLREFIAFGNKAVFTIDDPTYQRCVYISDGTAAGTFSIADGYSNTRDNAILNNKLYLVTAPTNANFRFLSETDGTWLNTNIVDTIGSFGIAPITDVGRGIIGLTQFNNKLYFRSYSGLGGSELWQSDGTNAGTGLLKDMFPGDYSSKPYGFTPFGNKLYFRTDDSVYLNINYTDGTVAGTQKVIMPGANYKNSNEFQKRIFFGNPLVPIGSTLFFANPYDSASGLRIYRMDMFPAEVGNIPQISSIDIYPNPTQGLITIDAENAQSIIINSIDGRQVYRSDKFNSDKITVDTRSFPAGSYTITTLLSDGTRRHGKFVKQ